MFSINETLSKRFDGIPEFGMGYHFIEKPFPPHEGYYILVNATFALGSADVGSSQVWRALVSQAVHEKEEEKFRPDWSAVRATTRVSGGRRALRVQVPMRGTTVMAAIGFCLAVTVGVPAYGAGYACRGVVADRLAELGIDSAEVSSIDSIRIGSNRRENGAVGVEVWVGFRTCRGNLVIVMDRHCRIKRTYGRGDCRAYLNEAR